MRKFILVIILVVSVLTTYAQDNSKTETEIRNLEQVLTTAVLNGDTATLKKYWAPEFMVNTPRNQVTATRDSVLLLQKAGVIDYSRFEKVTERILFEENTVITMGYEIIVSKNDTPAAKAGQIVKRRYTNVWIKKNGQWQQVARHASVICQ